MVARRHEAPPSGMRRFRKQVLVTRAVAQRNNLREFSFLLVFVFVFCVFRIEFNFCLRWREKIPRARLVSHAVRPLLGGVATVAQVHRLHRNVLSLLRPCDRLLAVLLPRVPAEKKPLVSPKTR